MVLNSKHVTGDVWTFLFFFWTFQLDASSRAAPQACEHLQKNIVFELLIQVLDSGFVLDSFLFICFCSYCGTGSLARLLSDNCI